MKNKLLIVLAVFFGSQAMAQNVGIGTASPSYKLQVEGDTYVNGGWLRVDGNKGVLFEDYGGGWFMQDATWIRSYGDKNIYHNTGVMRTDGTFQVGGSGSTFYAANSGNMAYRTDVLFANTAGNVGIGTASPSQKLEITGGSYPSILFSNNASGRDLYVGGGSQSSLGTTEAVIGVTNGNIHIDSRTSNQIYFQHYAQQNVIFNANGGNVGIGTASPGHKLDVNGTVRVAGKIINVTDPTGPQDAATKAYVDAQVGGVTETDPTWSGSANTSASIGRTGNVGIGTLSPSYKLDVNGNARANKFYGRINVEDTRSTNPAPTSYDKEVYFEFKSRSAIGVPGAGTYSGMMTLAPWGDDSGDQSHQLNFNNGGMYYRSGWPDNASWGSWSKVLTSGDIGASGSTNYISKFTGSSTLGNSQMYDNGSGVGIGTTSIPSDVRLEVNGAIGTSRMGIGGTYNSSQVQGIWTIAPNYKIDVATNDFGTQYGMVYAHTNAGTVGSKKPIAGWGHQIMLTSNGTRNISMSMSNGNAYFAGSMGIGTTSPSDKLDVHGDIGLYGKLAFRGNDSWLRLNQDGNFSSGVYTPGNLRADGGMYIENTSPTVYFTDTDHPAYMLHANSDRLYVLHGSNGSTSWNGNRPLTIYQGNKVGINNSTPSYELHVSGRIRSNGINETSDIRFKKDVQDLEGSLEKIEQLRGVSYYWRQDEFPEQKFNDGLDLGLIAQEVEQIIPEVVHTDNEGYKSVQYSHLVPVLVEAIKDLSIQLNDKDALLAEIQKEQINQACEFEKIEKDYTAQINKLSEKVEAYESLLNDFEKIDMEALKAAFAKNQYSASK